MEETETMGKVKNHFHDEICNAPEIDDTVQTKCFVCDKYISPDDLIYHGDDPIHDDCANEADEISDLGNQMSEVSMYYG
jgi:hypothetical protein